MEITGAWEAIEVCSPHQNQGLDVGDGREGNRDGRCGHNSGNSGDGDGVDVTLEPGDEKLVMVAIARRLETPIMVLTLEQVEHFSSLNFVALPKGNRMVASAQYSPAARFSWGISMKPTLTRHMPPLLWQLLCSP